jgi:hypothetical protein
VINVSTCWLIGSAAFLALLAAVEYDSARQAQYTDESAPVKLSTSKTSAINWTGVIVVAVSLLVAFQAVNQTPATSTVRSPDVTSRGFQ